MKGFWLILIVCTSFVSKAQSNAHVLWEKDVVDTCIVIPLGVDFGLCAMPLGWALSDSGCVMLSGCSMIGSNGIDYSTSFFQSSYQCNGACMQDTTVVLACVDSTLIDSMICCLDVYDPVCGCDSITYSNSCEAMFHGGVVSYTTGTCESAGIYPKWMTLVSIQPNPFTSNFMLTLGSEIEGIVRLFQANGIWISSQPFSGLSAEFVTDKLAPGSYFIQVWNSQNGLQVTKHIIKQ